MQTIKNKLLDSDLMSIAVDGEVKARYAWFEPLSPFSVSEKSIIVLKLPAPQRIIVSFFFSRYR